MKKFLVVLAMLLLAAPLAHAGQSVIVEVDGKSCMGEDKSRKQTEQEAMLDAKRRASEYALTRIKSETWVKDFQLEKDIIEAYTRASIRVIEETERGWYKDASSGDCFKTKIKAEVMPDKNVMADIVTDKKLDDNPSAPLYISLWPEKKAYKRGERMKLFLQGNKPFFAYIIYRNASGEVLQLLPNPFRKGNFLAGGKVYEVPSEDDRFYIEVTPPFGMEEISVYGSTSELGKLEVEPVSGVYRVKTNAADIGSTTRGVSLVGKGVSPTSGGKAEFYETKAEVETSER